MRIAFIQLGSFGDCINSTLMLRPIWEHYNKPQIDVYTTTLYSGAFVGNPLITNLIKEPCQTKDHAFGLYNVVPLKVEKAIPKYDLILNPAPILRPTMRNSLKHPEFGENLIMTFVRALEEEGIPYKWPITTELHLQSEEIVESLNWLDRNKVYRVRPKSVLMECHGESGQTFFNDGHLRMIVNEMMGAGVEQVFISRKNTTNTINDLVKSYPNRVYCVNDLTLRQCACLFNYCGGFISVSSGLSNVCNTNYCKKDIKWLELVNSPTVNSAPLRSDGKLFLYEYNQQAISKWIGDFVSYTE